MEKATIKIKIKTDGTVGSLASTLMALWFVAAVLFDEKQPDEGKRTFSQKQYGHLLNHSGVESITVEKKND